MPCYQISTMSVKIAAANRRLLERALNSLGLEYFRDGKVVYLQNGIIIGEETAILEKNQQGTLNAIKQAYSKQAVKKTMKKKKWTGKWVTKKNTQNQAITLKKGRKW